MGHARALINIDDAEVQEMIYGQILKYGFSVRKVEEIVRSLNEDGDSADQPKRKELPKEYKNYKGQLGKLFDSRVGISVNGSGKGKIVIPFNSGHDLERIVKIIENGK
jgi:ParB family transcriptional regulator, chromosome partitioning protein